uniref:Phospholipase A(2) n=1 Tax=Globodera pallida TaxID=36090 RepID=A0A183BJ60_GLOPA
MSLTILAIFCVTLAHLGNAKEEYEKLEHKWSCGTTWQWEKPSLTVSWSLSEGLSEAAVDTDCPSRKNRMNNCCVTHDACYANQLGQKNCDDNFCDCLEKATEGRQRCSIWEGPGFCRLVRLYGESAYRASAPPFWSSCGTLLASAKKLGCPCGTYKTWERCGILYMGYRYFCYAC